jgi:hypothetical protein
MTTTIRKMGWIKAARNPMTSFSKKIPPNIRTLIPTAKNTPINIAT